MSSNEPASSPGQAVHSEIANVIRDNVASGHLSPGTILSESALAEQFSVSRMPVARALRNLAAEGLIERVTGRGFRVQGAPSDAAPLGTPLLEIPSDVLASTRGRASWEAIYLAVERDLVGCMPFGRFKIIELTMADHYGVTRMVTRDLLARLEERGLIVREGRAQCFVPALTPQLMSDLYAVRRLLEPKALALAAARVERPTIVMMRDKLIAAEKRYPALSIEDLADFEQDLHVRLISACPNRRLIAALRINQLPLLATNHLFQIYLGLPKEEPFLTEHRLVMELLLNSSTAAASGALEAHLDSSLRKGVSRLETLRANHRAIVPPYLQLLEHSR